MKKQIIIKVFSVILSFAIMVAIIASTLTNYVERMLNKDYILAELDKKDIYGQILIEVEDAFENYIYQSGLEKDIIKNICTKEKIANDVKSIINGIYEQKEIVIDTKEIEDKLNSEIDKVIANEKRKISQEEQANIEDFKNTIIQSYKNSIGYNEKVAETIQTKWSKISSMLQTARTISIVVTIVLVAGLIGLNYKTILVGINYVCISLLSSGIVLLLANWLINSKIKIDEFLILSASLTNAITVMIKSCLNGIVTVGIWTALLGGFGIVLIAIKTMDEPTQPIFIKKVDKIKKAKVNDINNKSVGENQKINDINAQSVDESKKVDNNQSIDESQKVNNNKSIDENLKTDKKSKNKKGKRTKK